MAATAQGHAEFLARVNRIEKRGGGVSEVFNGDGITLRQNMARRRRCRGCFLKTPLALVLGGFAFLVAQYATFSVTIPEEYALPDYILGAQIFLALCLVLFFRLFFNLSGKLPMTMGFLGLALGVTAMHNLVHVAPDTWAMLFSPGWVSDIQAHTQAGTLQFRGTVISLG